MNLDFAIAFLESGADIATLEQESRQMRARMERLEAELEAERALSFRNQVAELEAQRDEFMEALEAGRMFIKLISPFEGDVTRKMDKAIAGIKGSAA